MAMSGFSESFGRIPSASRKLIVGGSMSKIEKITGRVVEVGNSVIAQLWTEFGSVHIEDDEGLLTRVNFAIATTDMPTSLEPGTEGTFYFRKIVTFRGAKHLLAGAEINGKLRVADLGGAWFPPLFAAVLSVPLIVIMVGLLTLPISLLVLFSMLGAQSDLAELQRQVSPTTELLHIRTL